MKAPHHILSARWLRPLCGLALAGVFTFGSAPSASATVVVTNLSETTVGSTAALFNVLSVGGSFTTGGSSYTLQSITPEVFGTTGSPSDFALTLYASGGLTPGVPLATWFGSGSPANITFQGTYALAAATTYFWAVASLDSGASTNFTITSSLAETSPVGWTMGDGFVFTTNNGASWNTSGNVIKASVDAIPEPTTAGLGALGLVGLLRRRRAS